MAQYATTLSIAGSDSSGGAGIQADLKTFSALGTYGMTAITAITAQNTTGVSSIMPVTPQMVADQIDAVFSDIRPDAVKIGMLMNSQIIVSVAHCLQRWKPRHIVLDPVMIATSGSRLIDEEAISTLISLLLPMATVVTPNRPEAECIAGGGIRICDAASAATAAKAILNLGAKAVLIKGGHIDTGNGEMTDFLFTQGNNDTEVFTGKMVDTRNTHGTGCTLSSAIAAELAKGHTLTEAVGLAKQYLSKAVEAGASVSVGHGHGPVNHLFAPIPLNKNYQYKTSQ